MMAKQRRVNDKRFKSGRNDADVQAFYKTKDWERLRQAVISYYFGIDIYEYYTTGQIIEGYTAHHIIEVKAEWSKRLDIHNVIFLSEASHQYIHSLYNKGKKRQTQSLINGLQMRFAHDFKMMAGVQKTF
jgi:hypothetical protein